MADRTMGDDGWTGQAACAPSETDRDIDPNAVRESLAAPNPVAHRVTYPAESCIVLGGGSHARVIVDAMLLAGRIPQGVLDADQIRWNGRILDVPVLGGDDLLPELAKRGMRYFVVGVGSTGHGPRTRRMLFEWGVRCGLRPWTVEHVSVIRSPTAAVAAGAQLLAGSILGTYASIGANTIVNSGAIIEHDCTIGAHVHVAPGARLGGNVHVADDALVGIGATVRPGITIGARSVIGAGAVIVEDVPADVVVVGVPGRIHKRLAA